MLEIKEQATFVVPRNKLSLQEGMRENCEHDLLQMLSELSPSSQQQFWNLEDCLGSPKSAIGICRTNTFTQNENKQMLGCFLQGARFNHSCRPNVVWHWGDSPNSVLKMHVSRSCRKGEELCISYLPDLEMSLEQRRLRLQHSHHFLCMCEACSEPCEAKLAQSEKLRAEFRMLDAKVKNLIRRNPEEAYQVTCRMSVIIDAEFGGDLWLHSRTLNDAFHAALVCRNRALASSTMEKAIEAWLLAGGNSNQALLQEMQSYAAPPLHRDSLPCCLASLASASLKL